MSAKKKPAVLPARAGQGYEYKPRGMLALAPDAYGQTFVRDSTDVEPPTPLIWVVAIRGPLVHHMQPWPRDGSLPPDSYDEIRSRVAWALECCSAAQENGGQAALVLAIDSPGGVVNGCFETAKTLRAMADAARVPLHAYIDGQCCSAAYAFASVCHSITAPPTAIVGSIGVLSCLIDATVADAELGLKFTLIASGARKLDSNAHTPVSEDAIAAEQARVDDLASYFFEFVAEHRRSISAASVQALQAETFTGLKAQTLQLVDNVLSLDALVASLTADPKGPNYMAGKPSALMNALVAAMSSDDPKEAAEAKKAMAAICAEEKKDEDKPEASAESDGDEDEKPKKDEDKPEKKDEAKVAAASTGAAASAALDPRVARAVKNDERRERERLEGRAAERKQLLASRPDLSPEQLAIFGDPKQTKLETLRLILPTIPKVLGATASAALAATQASTKPTGGDTTDQLSAVREGYTLEELDRQMGLSKPQLEASWQGDKFTLPTLTTAQAREQLKKRAEAAQKGAAQ